VIRLRKDGVRWELEECFEPLLERVLDSPGRVIKESPAKLVTAHQWAGKTYYLKRYRMTSVPLRPLKYWFKRSPTRIEWQHAQQIQARGVPLPRHLAVGERWSARGLLESLLITEGVEGVPLNMCASQQSPATQFALGRFMRQMHERGVLQRDLHHNIMVRDQPLELQRVDVYHAEVKPALSERERRDNIAFLNISMALTDEFFRGYGWDADQARRVRERTREMRRDRYHGRSSRALKTNAEFASRRFGGLRWQVRLPFLDGTLQAILSAPDRCLAECGALLKDGRAATVGARGGFVLKRSNFRRGVWVLKNIFRPSRARVAYRRAYHLELAGVPTARPVAVAEKRCGRLLLRSYLLTEEIAASEHLGAYLQRVQRVEPAARKAVARLVARLHEEGFRHRDLKETNILLDRQLQPWLIDLDGVRFLRHTPEGVAAADLWRLARGAMKYPSCTRADRVMFLREYCRARHLRRAPRLRPAWR
jgi:tRNA A-37 threonylcarbamoyl transferase component Bud32